MPRRALVGLAVAAALSAAPAGAVAAVPFRDRVLTGPVAHRAAVPSASPTRSVRTPDGLDVEVRVSASVPSPDTTAREIVDFLASRLHGSELGRLRVFIGTPGEISSICGDPRILACYAAGERRMYIPDRDPGVAQASGFTRDYAITHEYGHHIASFRSNTPFSALNYGAKYWSSYELVCAGTSRGLYFPGNQGDHYLDDPGEAFADTYAHIHYPNVPWQFNATLRPDPGSFAALRRDVLDPWRGSRRHVVSGSLNATRRSRSTVLHMTLDGSIDLRLRGPQGANFDVALVRRDGSVIDRTRAGGSRDHLRLTVCRARSQTSTLLLRVIRRTGAGRYALRVLYPG